MIPGLISVASDFVEAKSVSDDSEIIITRNLKRLT